MQDYINKNKDRFLNELLDLLRIPSVSTDLTYQNDVKRAADFLADRLKEAGAEKTTVFPTAKHPIVYGEKIIDPTKPTVLVYGHYDVQPPDPLELWNSPPFEPVIKDGNIYARGACDDKGQMYMHVKAFEVMMQTSQLPCNVKFMIEGEEEIGSENLISFVRANKDLLKADIILISDTSMIDNETPSVQTGLRGLSYLEVEVATINRDLHSGLYGGAVANPIQVLCKMIDSLKDENGKITIPNFYDRVVELSQEERAEMAEAPFDVEVFKQSIGLKDIAGEVGYTTPERTSIRPTLDVNGIWGGYTAEGAKTVIPAKAFAKISMRLVPNQDPDEITELFVNHFKKIAPPTATVEVRPHHGAVPVVVEKTSIGYQAASKALEKTFGRKAVPFRAGGSIPVVALFKQELGLDTVLMGFGLDSDAIHSPNEKYGLFNFYKGIETIPYFYQYFAEMSK